MHKTRIGRTTPDSRMVSAGERDDAFHLGDWERLPRPFDATGKRAERFKAHVDPSVVIGSSVHPGSATHHDIRGG